MPRSIRMTEGRGQIKPKPGPGEGLSFLGLGAIAQAFVC